MRQIVGLNVIPSSSSRELGHVKMHYKKKWRRLDTNEIRRGECEGKKKYRNVLKVIYFLLNL